MRAALAVVVLAGCDKLLGLGDIAPVPDANPYAVTGTLLERYATNDATYMPLVEQLVPDRAAATATLDDGTTPIVDYQTDGTFSFPLAHAGQRYRLSLAAADGGFDVESDAPQLALASTVAARPVADRTLVTRPTPISLILSAAGGLYGEIYVASTGQWSLADTGTTGAGSTQSTQLGFDWRLAGALAPPIGLLDASDDNDLLYVLEYSPKSLPSGPYLSVTHYRTVAVDQVDGVALQLTLTLDAPTTASCLSISASVAEEDQRWVAAIPGATSSGADWLISAIPSYQLGTTGALVVTYTPRSPPYPSTSAIDQTFYNPYLGSVLVANLAVGLQRALQLPGTQPFLAPFGTQLWVQAPTSAACAGLALPAGMVGIAGDPMVNGVAIAADATAVALPAAPRLDVAWDLASSGPVDVTNVAVYELRAVAGYTVPHLIDQTSTTTRSAWLSTSKLVAGRTYVLRFDAMTGYPGAATGDYATAAFPHAVATSWSHYFTVQ
ncbi:MAG: hypothetical protein ACM31C_17620 [Acidobacteriota bacterium]